MVLGQGAEVAERPTAVQGIPRDGLDLVLQTGAQAATVLICCFRCCASTFNLHQSEFTLDARKLKNYMYFSAFSSLI